VCGPGTFLSRQSASLPSRLECRKSDCKTALQGRNSSRQIKQAHHSKREPRLRGNGRARANYVAARMHQYRRQTTVGWITAALTICHSLFAQTGIRPAIQFRDETSPTVTLQELQHVVPSEARAEMEKAEKARMKHQRDQQIDHLKKALHLDPENVAARNNLSICLVPIDLASAIAHWEEAIRINPHIGLLFSNLAVGHALNHNLEAAEDAARRSIELDRTNSRARALLGLLLVEQHKYTTEALTLLERSANEYPMTYVFAAKTLIERGEFEKARAHIQKYLSDADMEYRDDAAEMLDFINRIGHPRELSQNR